mmetsp:Transcript_13215/g.31367  ORF Transcript_13215/g.31367 Transcript_13215/m.31367 type:complete len:470 (-) Transcript_13215:1242-2651(-)
MAARRHCPSMTIANPPAESLGPMRPRYCLRRLRTFSFRMSSFTLPSIGPVSYPPPIDVELCCAFPCTLCPLALSPSKTSAHAGIAIPSEQALMKASRSFTASAACAWASFSSSAPSGGRAARSSAAIRMSCISVERSAVANPMLMAVSSLSPVSTQILIKALPSCAMHSPTFSWSLSSRAVTPCSCSADLYSVDVSNRAEGWFGCEWFSSIWDAIARSASSLPSGSSVAATYCLFHAAYSSAVMARPANTSVRRPWSEKRSMCIWVSSKNEHAAWSINGMTEVSAPLTRSMRAPRASLTTTEVRLRLLSNAFTFRIVYVTSDPLPTGPSDILITISFITRLQKKKPQLRAAVTNAPSSGDSAWYKGSSEFCPYSTWTPWLTARLMKNSRSIAALSCCSHLPKSNLSSTNLNPLSRPAGGTGSSGSSLPWRRAIARSTSQYPRPYWIPATEHFLNSMRFCVSVPVLSEKM